MFRWTGYERKITLFGSRIRATFKPCFYEVENNNFKSQHLCKLHWTCQDLEFSLLYPTSSELPTGSLSKCMTVISWPLIQGSSTTWRVGRQTPTQTSFQQTYKHTPWSSVQLVKLMVSELVTRSPRVYATRSHFTVFTISCHFSLSWATSVQSTTSCFEDPF